MPALGVGLIGANATRGWAREAHVPAVRATDGFELRAVATRRQASADEAARAFDVPLAFGDPTRLIEDPSVDVVVVASSVATHSELIGAALRAGKHVVTEWPLAVGTDAMSAIADEAERSGVRTALGLQARRNPAVLRAAELVADGVLGRVRSARVTSTTAAFGPVVDAGSVPLEDPAAGMHLLTIQAAHTMDLLAVLAGTPTRLAAQTTVRFPEPTVAGGGTASRVLPDHVAVHGRLDGGGTFVAEVAGGRPPGDTPFEMVLDGDGGSLRLTGGAPRGFQSGVLTLAVDGTDVAVPDQGLPDPVVNVAGVYRALRDVVLAGSRTAPSFADGVRLAALLDDVRTSAAHGATVTPSAPWPRR